MSMSKSEHVKQLILSLLGLGLTADELKHAIDECKGAAQGTTTAHDTSHDAAGDHGQKADAPGGAAQGTTTAHGVSPAKVVDSQTTTCDPNMTQVDTLLKKYKEKKPALPAGQIATKTLTAMSGKKTADAYKIGINGLKTILAATRGTSTGDEVLELLTKLGENV